MKVLSIFGTRPEAIKMAPLVKLLHDQMGENAKVCITSQHREMLAPLLKLFNIKADYDLNIMKENQSLTDMSVNVLKGVETIINDAGCDRVIVQGDTTTSAISSLVAFYHKIPVTHVEAGLRSYDRYSPWPEEVNRKIITSISDMHCVPTKLAYQRMLKENIPEGELYLTGNTVIDTLYAIDAKLDQDSELNNRCRDKFNLIDDNKKTILITGHRRENFGEPFKQICYAIKQIAEKDDVQCIFPVHLNPNVNKIVKQLLSHSKNVHLVDPINYIEFVYLMRKAYLILTDSGGVQEEAPALGIPVLIMRNVTERPEAVEAGTAKIVGVKQEHIVEEVERLLNDQTVYRKMQKRHSPFGDGHAAIRIYEAICNQDNTQF